MKGCLEFVRIVEVERRGRMVKRHISALHPHELEAVVEKQRRIVERCA